MAPSLAQAPHPSVARSLQHLVARSIARSLDRLISRSLNRSPGRATAGLLERSIERVFHDSRSLDLITPLGTLLWEGSTRCRNIPEGGFEHVKDVDCSEKCFLKDVVNEITSFEGSLDS